MDKLKEKLRVLFENCRNGEGELVINAFLEVIDKEGYVVVKKPVEGLACPCCGGEVKVTY